MISKQGDCIFLLVSAHRTMKRSILIEGKINHGAAIDLPLELRRGFMSLDVLKHFGQNKNNNRGMTPKEKAERQKNLIEL